MNSVEEIMERWESGYYDDTHDDIAMLLDEIDRLNDIIEELAPQAQEE